MLQWFSFRGQTNRLGFLIGTLGPMLLSVVILTISTIIGMVLEKVLQIQLPRFASLALSMSTLIGAYWAFMAATVRRMRDLGWPIWLGVTVMLLSGFGSGALIGPFVRQHPIAGSLTWAGSLLVSTLFWLLIALWPSADHGARQRKATAAVFDDAPADSDEAGIPEAPQAPARPAAFDALGGVIPRARFGLRRQSAV